MPTYTILIKDKSTLSTKETQITAKNQQEAIRIAEGRGQKVVIIKNIS
jgi:hypothetical protein